MPRTAGRVLTALLAILTALICLVSCPERFDAVDGAEFAVTGRNLDIPHPPGYPLFTWILRLTGIPSGHVYSGLLITNCILAAAAYLVLVRAFGTLHVGRAGSILGPFLFLNLPPVLMQTSVLEVHTLAILLVAIAIAFRDSRAGPYLFSLALFGGHPTSVTTLPLAWSPRFRSSAVLAALLPATLWLYVPIRAGSALIAHYTRPESIPHMLSYLGLYGGRLSWPSTEGFEAILSSTGLLAAGMILVLVAVGWKNWKRVVPSLSGALLFLSLYRAEDIDSMAWLALFPVAVMAGTGISRLFDRGGIARISALTLVAACCTAGITRSVRAGDDVAYRVSRDMLGSIPYQAVYVTVSHDTFYLAYLLDIDDCRPDILPVDLYGNYFDLVLDEPLPASIGDRPVYATRAWGNRELQLTGLVFGPGDALPDWDSYETFGFSGTVRDRRAGDLLAEAWMRRALQEDDPQVRDSLGRIALEWAATGITRNRIGGLLVDSTH